MPYPRLASWLLMVVSGCCGWSCGGGAEDASRAVGDVCADRTGRTLPRVLGDAGGVALGCLRLEGRPRLLELYAVADAGGGPCIVVTGLADGPRACGRAPGEREPAVRRAISTGPIVRRPGGSPVEVYGETRADVSRVVLRHTLPGGGRGTTRAALIEAVDAATLDAAGIDERFGYFVGQVPASSREVVADALDRAGRRLGRADFSGLVRGDRPSAAFVAEAPGSP